MLQSGALAVEDAWSELHVRELDLRPGRTHKACAEISKMQNAKCKRVSAQRDLQFL